MKARFGFSLALITLVLAACAPLVVPMRATNPTAAQTAALPATSSTAVRPASPAPMPSTPMSAVTPAGVPAGWQVYTNAAGFALSYPPNWTAEAQPDMTPTIHTVALKGPEGEIDLNWGTAFGTVCPSGSMRAGVRTAWTGDGYITTCYWKNTDGTESWIQPSWNLSPDSFFSFRAVTSNAQSASRDAILQILFTVNYSLTDYEPYGDQTPTPVNTYTDPFSYCTSVGTIDTPDARYTGAQTPASILPAGPWPFGAGSAAWRCMDEEVYACYVGANTPCVGKADSSTTPNEGMRNWCKDNPNDASIPDLAAGHQTIYAWSCKNGVPVPGHQRLHVDAQGYPIEYWHPIPPQFALLPAIVPVGWKIYTNPAGFAISYPPYWTAQPQPDTSDGAIHTEALKGPEGEVDLSWGVGFGGACPEGYATVMVAQADIQTCYLKKAGGTESWSQMSHALPSTGFQGRAATNSAQQASHDTLLQILSTLTFDPGPPPDIPRSGYPDPFGYCAALGTLDYQDARYLGPKTPTSITAGLETTLKVPASPAPFPQGSVYWRCMGGDVYACAAGANVPCWNKANTSREPSADMQAFCREQPDADVIPASVTGHETIYTWSCKDGASVMGQQVHQVDAAGYVVDYWYAIPAPAQPAAATPVPTTATGASGH